MKNLQRVSIVIPVYAGERSLPMVVAEIEKFNSPQISPEGHEFVVCELLLVHDCGPDRSDTVIDALAAKHSFIRPIWLSRNYGQHAATMAGMASATGDWVVTMDEDGQQDPESIKALIDLGIRENFQLVYAQPTNAAPHGLVRNFFSKTAKIISTRLLGNKSIGRFNSFRLIDGEIARTLSAYCGNGVYLDVGLFWITGRVGHCPLKLREEFGRPSGYSFLALVKHFWSLVLTTGTRPLRLITIVGFFSILFAIGFAIYAMYKKYTGQVPIEGWTSLAVVVAFFSGVILTALGVIAEYLAVTMGIVMGKPLYVVSSKPTRPNRP
ncbi:glycosyltransferase involved in cell wall biosynthesis [Variovorax boronicumulans]|uniref:glycosyltransferase n=1 Tax=Variovorax boronicumulans TaxID=436515 RepID=UPI0024770978|nr:glycosyltransferase [Variovorax boronicumulans]MDH6167545.1 glycosyltransferase involved in cell wall biosynthesis [Variovorax boronicumulans]